MKANRENGTRPLNTTEAAAYLNISKQNLYRLVSQRKLPCYKPEGKLIYFAVEDLNAFIYRNRVSANYELADKAEAMLNQQYKAPMGGNTK
jgi:excisionase family DNA binding protein